MDFALGFHHPTALSRTNVHLMIARQTLAGMKRLPRAKGQWLLDSGGFSQIAAHGKWVVSQAQYIEEARRFDQEIGGLIWAACQDWMCEPFMLAKTGLDVIAHQQRTVTSYLSLRMAAPDIAWLPVLQGWTEHEYLNCADLYEAEGVNLARYPVIGLGSVCRRQRTVEIESIVRTLAARGYRLHGFGMKTLGLARCADVLASADSMAWSRQARYEQPITGHPHKTCANCLDYALGWRRRLLSVLGKRDIQPRQLMMVGLAA